MAQQSGGRAAPLVRLAAPVLVASAVLLGAAAAESGIAGGTATVRAEPTSIAFSVAATLVGLAAIAALATTLFSILRMFRMHGGFGRERRSFLSTVLGALATAVMVGLLVYLIIHFKHPHLAASQTHTAGAHPPPAGHTKSAVHFVGTASFATVAVIVALAVVLFGISLWRRRGRSGWRSAFGLSDRSSHEHLPEDEEDPGAVAAAMAQVTVADPQNEPDPRRAVVLAYMQMTAAAEAAGAGRRHDATAREFLERLLDSAGCPRVPTRALTSSFELARYSRDPVTEADRSFAIRALDEIRRSLGAATQC